MINFIYFDLGGVIVKDFMSREWTWERVKKNWGIPAQKSKAFESFWNKYEPQLLKGRDVNTLIPLINKGFETNLSNKCSMVRDIRICFARNKSIWPVIKRARRKCGIGILTNLYPGQFAEIERMKIMPPRVKWDVMVDSSIEKCQKPDLKIFRIAEARCGERGSNILFIENSPKHIEAAKKLGWRTFYYNSKDFSGSSEELERFLSAVK